MKKVGVCTLDLSKKQAHEQRSIIYYVFMYNTNNFISQRHKLRKAFSPTKTFCFATNYQYVGVAAVSQYIFAPQLLYSKIKHNQFSALLNY